MREKLGWVVVRTDLLRRYIEFVYKKVL